jgi:predicted transposase YdaD
MIQLQIISNLRNLQPLVIKNIRKMPLIIDLSNDPFFVEQFEKVDAEATAKGEARGEARGEAKGKLEGKAEAIESMLKTGRFQAEEIADILTVALSWVLEIEAKMKAPVKKNGKTPKK